MDRTHSTSWQHIVYPLKKYVYFPFNGETSIAKSHFWVHFACYAHEELAKSIQSMLKKNLEVSTVIAKSVSLENNAWHHWR